MRDYSELSLLKYQENYLRFEEMVAFPVLMDFFELCYSLGQVQHIPQIFENIKNIALSSEENYITIIDRLESFSKESTSPYLQVQNPNYGIESIKQGYLEQKASSFNFGRAKSLYKELFENQTF